MKKVDYRKLSEQYASFLVAVGGVSITALTLVLSLGDSATSTEVNSRSLLVAAWGSDPAITTEVNSLSFLVAALSLATVSCFIGAHMMAETAAFIEFHKKLKPPVSTGERLFLIATTNIFLALVLVLFALMLLPTTSDRVHSSAAPIGIGVFALIVGGALYWMILAAKYRMAVPDSGPAIWIPVIIASLLGIILCFLSLPKDILLWVTFAPSAVFTFASLIWFATIFKGSDALGLQKARIKDIWFFSSAIAFSYAPLVVAGIRTMRGK